MELDARLQKVWRTKPPATSALVGKLPNDPRVSAFLVDCIEKARWPGSSAESVWKRIFKKLVEIGEPHAIAPLRAAAAMPPRFQGAAFTQRMCAQIGATADAIEKKLPKGTKVPPKPVSDGPERWIESVWSAPDDDAVRAVAGDALLVRGDPWGELIALQRGGGDPDAIAKLIRKHGKRIAGPLADVAAVSKMTFEGGFVASAIVGRDMVGKRFWMDVAKAPHWATLRSVTLVPHNMPAWWFAEWVAHAPLARLRSIDFGPISLERSSSTDAWRITLPKRRFGGLLARQATPLFAALPLKAPVPPAVRALLDAL